MLKSMKFMAAVAVTAGFAFPANALTKVGTLDCDVSAGIGMVVASQKGVKCVFTPTQGHRPEVYLGTISKYGIDVGATNGGKMIWTVFAPTTDRLRGALAGTYAGATAVRRLVPASAPMHWLAARTARSRCSRSQCKARPA